MNKCERCGQAGAERVKRVPLPDGDTFTLLSARHLCKGCTQELAEAAQRALNYAAKREKKSLSMIIGHAAAANERGSEMKGASQ